MQYNAYIDRLPATTKPATSAPLPTPTTQPIASSKRGGPRPNAGRKSHGRQPYTICLHPGSMATLRARAKAVGAKAVADVLERDYPPQAEPVKH